MFVKRMSKHLQSLILPPSS